MTIPSVVAQQITENDLIGVWEIKAADFKMFTIDFETDNLKLSDDFLNGDEERESKLKNNLKKDVIGLKSLIAEFYKGYTMKVFTDHDPIIDEGHYSIIEKDNQYFIVATDINVEFPIKIENELLYWEMPMEEEGESFIIVLSQIKS